MAVQTQKLKKNIPGFYEGGLFHPIRTPEYVKTGSKTRKATPADRKKYDRDKAGDNDDVFDKEIRKSRNLRKAETNWRQQEENRIRREMFGGTGDGEGQTLVQFIRAAGGIRRTYNKKTGKSYDAGELDGLTFKQSKKRGLVSDDKGKPLDKMMQAAREAGYDVNDENDLIDKLDDEIRSGKATYQSHGYLDYKDNPKMKKRPTKPRPKKNGILATAATIAVGTSAALNVYDRLNRNTKKPTPAASGASSVLRHNKGSADVPHHEREFEKLLVAIEKGDFAKIRSAKMHGKLANWSEREVDYFINQAKWTSQLKLNPTPALIAKAENSLLKKNGILSRKWARHKAASAYRRELKLQSAIDRAKKKRAGYESKAKKNPTKKTLTLRIGHYGGNLVSTTENLKGQGITLFSDGKDNLKGNKTYKVTDKALAKLEKSYEILYQNKAVTGKQARASLSKLNAKIRKQSKPQPLKNPSAAFEGFQGRPSTKDFNLETPEGAPKTLYCLGKLFELRLKGQPNLDFRREASGKTFYLCADEKNNQLWIAGGKMATPDATIKKGFSAPLAQITHVVYETKKVHLDDTKPTGYIHKFGEEGGEQPTLAIDGAGFPIIVGGTYEITPLGIAD